MLYSLKEIGCMVIHQVSKILTDIDVDLRTNEGTPAVLGEGSTITFKITKFRELPFKKRNKREREGREG